MLNRLLVLNVLFCLANAAAVEPPNILIITVDDMNADSVGAFGCKLSETTPNVDAFARSGLRFEHAHVQVGNCMPGRNIMWSGMLSHVNGVEGFVQNRDADYPVLCDLAKSAGYFAAIRGKVSHSTPYSPYGWDAVLDRAEDGRKFHIKAAKGYGESTRQGIAQAKQAGKPFCLLVNISDPHKPFYAQGSAGKTVPDPHVPSRVFTAEDVPVPGFLPDDEVIRKELAHYYSSVRRADDCFGEVMSALDDSGEAANTFVIFFSDHGMPLPFAKTQLYHHSTHTPLIVRWPSVTEPGAVDRQHMVSAVDLLPTLLEVMGYPHPAPERLHGRSFLSVVRGQEQADRDHVVLQYNENSGRSRHPMRGIQTREYLYLYNPWSDGRRKFATATTGTMTYRQMVARAASEPDLAARLELFDHRVLEELYDVRRDPDCLVNLIDRPDHLEALVALRKQLVQALEQVADPVAPLLADVENQSLRERYMAVEDQRSEQAKRQRAKQRAAKRKPETVKLRDALKLQLPESASPGKVVTVVVRYRVPDELGDQEMHVTLKESPSRDKNGPRIERQVVVVSGTGERSMEFSMPETLQAAAVRVAVFLGEDYESNLQHINSAPIPVELAVSP